MGAPNEVNFEEMAKTPTKTPVHQTEPKAYRKKQPLVTAYQSSKEMDIPLFHQARSPLEETVHVNIGDWIVIDEDGGKHVFTPDNFERIYEPANN